MKKFSINIKKYAALKDIGRRDLVAVEISAYGIKAAYMKILVNRAELSRVFYKDISGMQDLDISRSLRAWINDLPNKGVRIINVISSNLVISKNIEIPSIDPKEIKGIINLQAGRHTPYSREEVIVDYLEIGTYRRSYTKILLIILARHILKRQVEILVKAGLRLERVVLAPECIAHFLPKLVKSEGEGIVSGVAHIDLYSTDFIVALGGKAVFVRSIPLGARNFREEKERSETRFVEELRRSMESYHGENIEKGPALFLCTGAVEGLGGLETLLATALNMPVRVMPYFSALTVSSDLLKDSAASFKDASYLDVISACICADEAKVDLTPDDLKLKRTLEERGRDLIKTGIYIMAIFVLFIFILITKIYSKGAYVKELDEKFRSLHAQAKDLERNFTQVGLVKNYLLRRGHSLEVVSELHERMPLNLRFEDVRYDAQGKLVLRGSAESMSVVFSFVDGLEKSVFFKEVKTKYASKRKEGPKEIVDFEINCGFENEGVK